MRVRLTAALVALLAGAIAIPAAARAAPLAPLDGRGWEMVSPAEKNGGEVQGPEANGGGDVLQAAAGGEAVTFSSASSFGAEALGAPVASQYVSRRGAGGWSTRDVTLPTVSGAYPDGEGVPYRLFSADLARAVLWIGRRCEEGEECPRSYSLRDTAAGTLTPLPEAPGLSFAGASPDLRQIVLTAAGGLYEWSEGQLDQLSATPGARLAEPAQAVSSDGSRVYLTDGGDLYLREGAQTKQVDEAVGGGGQLGAVTPGGSLAFFTKAGHLYRFSAAAGTATEIDPGGAVEGPLQISADGARLAFLSKAPLSGYDNTDRNTGEPDSEVFLYDATAAALTCVSCHPKGIRPIGPSSIPGAIANGTGPDATHAYKPRAMTDGGRRIFFDSRDALVAQDTNHDSDVYEWEAQETGSCATPGGCVNLISNGRSEDGASFVDASESGRDAFFLTGYSLVPTDPGAVDLYDAREGGGFPLPESPIPCEGDACQPLPSPPEDPTPGTLAPTPGNPPVQFPPTPCAKGKRRVERHGKTRCVAKRHRHRPTKNHGKASRHGGGR